MIYHEIADSHAHEPIDAQPAWVAGINAIRTAKSLYQSPNAHIYAGTRDIEESLLTRLARCHTGAQRRALQQEALTLSEEAIDIYMGSHALEDAGEVYLNQAAIVWQQHLDTQHPNGHGITALHCCRDAQEFLAKTQRPMLFCATSIALAEILIATRNPIDGLPHALPHLWEGYTLATTLHDAPHIQQALKVFRQMQT